MLSGHFREVSEAMIHVPLNSGASSPNLHEYGMADVSTTSTAAKGYDCAFCDKSTKIGTLVVLNILINMKPGTHRYRYGNRPPS